MLLFQSQIEEHQKLAEYYRELAAKREAKAAELVAIERQVMGAIQTLNEIKQNLDADAIATLQSAVMGLFATTGNDGGNQPTLATPDTDPTGLTGLVAEADDDDDFELLYLNGVPGDCLTTDDLEDTKPQRLTYTQAIKNRCSACWGYEVKSKDDIKAGFINRTDLSFMGAVNLERTGREFYETVESYLNKLYYNGQASQLEECPDSSRTGQYYELASPLVCLLWEDAPLLGQSCPVSFESSQQPTTPFVELVKVSDAIAYQKKHDGEILCCYVGFEKKSVAKSWMKFLEPMAAEQELREAQRLQEYQWELKITGLSIGQIQRLSQEPIGKAYRAEIDSLRTLIVKPPAQPAAQPVKFEQDDIVTPLLTPDGSYKVIQIMPNGILDCENLTTGNRKGLRPGAVSLVEKAKKPSQLAIELDSKLEVHAKYARVKLKADDFYGQVFPVVKETEQGATLLTHLGNRWFRADCLEFIDPDAPVLVAVRAGAGAGAGADDGWDF
jgi:hypothetical protein